MQKKRILATAAATVVAAGALVAAVQLSNASAAEPCATAWQSGKTYTNQKVSHAGHNWTAKWWTQDQPSKSEWGPWLDNGNCGGSTTPPPPPPNSPPPPPPNNPPGGNVANWQQGKTYRPGDKVRFTDGKCYVAEHENPGYDPTISTWFWDPSDCGGSTNPPPPPPNNPPGNGKFIVSEQQFNQMFPGRVAFYSYKGLTDALSAYPAFAKSGTLDQQKQEAAAFLANIGHETGGLVHIREINTANYPHYCDASQPYGCPAGQSAYYGKGPIQLSWNFNYKAAGDALGIDLLHNPELVATDSAVSWKTGIWYWMTQQGPSHNLMLNGSGFGATIRSINGIECNGGHPDQVSSRVASYERFTQLLGTGTGPGSLRC